MPQERNPNEKPSLQPELAEKINGQKEVAIEIVKYVAPLAAGGLGGYGLGYAKGQKSKDTQKDTSS